MTFADSLYLLMLDEKKGDFDWVAHRRFDHAMAGAILMELALANRIDADLDRLVLVNAEPVGDGLLDRVLGMFGKEPKTRNASWWIEELALRLGDLKDILLARLNAAGVLKETTQKGFLGLKKTRWQVAADHDDMTVLLKRIRTTVLGDDIPDPRDIVLVSLLCACNLMGHLFTPRDLLDAKERIDLLCRMDLIGQAVYRVILDEIHVPIAY
jgi:hypothetical protein